ncbi:hypothetical protein AMAG_16356 [Allomyces macrogynus ATCC 38327]|uniref:Peptidase S8/S53 domain-containing protein n=1 Tax=Allomyces macrogynus (strain ATCC 38327) TaxID=578462 RepID=A0A0L0TB00_ALLM3|nr:hypothetical protein AMAG_16356 [Allomyces macrogynus ATCC 38327]|eukprot:KNE71932.1 hypothetical protein AMAG_16356 [Allomyces macrogynus ATCC 38327]
MAARRSSRSARRATRKSSLLALLLVAALAYMATTTEAALPADVIRRAHKNQLPKGTGIVPGKYIVQFDAEPAIPDTSSTAESFAPVTGSPAAAQAQQADFKNFLATQGIQNNVAVQQSYSHVFNGVAVKVNDEAHLETVAKAPGVKAVFPVLSYKRLPVFASKAGSGSMGSLVKRDTTDAAAAAAGSAHPNLIYAHNMTGVTQLHQNYGLSGKGIKVAILDTGIDYLHPAFWVPGKQCKSFKGDGCRVVDGQDFVGDDYDSNSPLHSTPNPGPSPMDCAGHGTHVAGIVGGNYPGVFQGVAPEVTFYAGRIFGCDGSTATDVIISAIEASFKAKADLINMSLGGGQAFPSYPDSQVVDKLARRGMLVGSALGNDGDKGEFQASSPGVARNGFGVGSFDNINLTVDKMTANVPGGPLSIPAGFDNDIKAKWPKTALPLKRSPNPPTATDDGCNAFPAGYFTGKVALIKRGTCDFALKAKNAIAAGASGVVIYNKLPGWFVGTLSSPNLGVPVAFIQQADGETLYARASDDAAATILFSGDKMTIANPTGGQPSDFSSWGLDATLKIKPDIAAPGGEILSAWPLKLADKSGLNTISGTSMATPYVVGSLALYLEKIKPKEKNLDRFEHARVKFQNTARPALHPDTGLPWPVGKQGPGLLNVLDALTTDVTITPSRIELGDSPKAGDSKSATLKVTNSGSKPVTFRVLHQQAASVFGEGALPQADLKYSKSGARVTLSASTITVAAGQSATVNVIVEPYAGELPPHTIESGYVVFEATETSSAQTATLRVPYAVMVGDYSTYQLLDGEPVISTAPLGFWDLKTDIPDLPSWDSTVKETKVFSLQGLDKPLLFGQSVHVSRLAAIALYDTKTNKKLGYLPNPIQTLTNGGFFAPDSGNVDETQGKELYGWDGTYFKTIKAALGLGDDKAKAIDAPNGAYYWQFEITPPALDEKNYYNKLRSAWKSPVILIDRTAGTSTTTSTTSTAASTSASTTATTTSSTASTTGVSSTTTGTDSATATGSATGTTSVTVTGSQTATATGSQTATGTATATGSASSTAAGTATATGSASSTLSGTATAPDQTKTTGTGSATATATTGSGSITATGTASGSATATGTASGSATATGTASGSATITGTATATTTQSPGTTVIPCPPCPGGTKTVIIVQPTATVTTTVAPCPVCPGGTKTVIIVPPTQTVTQTVTPQPTMTTVPCNVCPGGIKTVIIIPPVGTQTDVCTIEPTHTVVPCKDANTCPPSGSTTQVIVQPTVPASPTTAGPAPTVTTEPCGKCPGGVKTIIIVPPTGTQTAPATVTPTNTVVPCNECNGGVKTVIVIPPPAQPTVTSTVVVPESPAETTPVPVATTPAPVPVATQPAGDSYGELEVPEEPIASKPKRCHRKKTQQRHYTMAAY